MVYKIGDFCKTNISSYSAKEKWDEIHYLDTGNITAGKIADIQRLVPGVDTVPSRAKRKVQVNDIIYSTVRPNQCHYGIIKKYDPKMLVSTGFAVITVDPKIADADYIYYFLTQREVVETLHAIGEQSTSAYPSIKPSDIEELEIDLPDLKTQRAVAIVLSALDEKIVVNHKINDNLEQQAQILFQSWYVDFEPFGGSMPNDWETVSLDTIADFQNGYAFKSSSLLNEPLPDTYRVFKQGHINRGGGFNSEGTKSWYPKADTKSLTKYILHKGDILMAMTDMKDNVAILGNTAIMPVDNEYIVNQRVGLLRANGKNGITYPFIYLLTNSKEFLTDLRSRANSGVQVNLSSAEIKSSETVLAPKEINEEFAAIVTPMLEVMMVNQLENDRLAQIRDALLPKLMSGEIDISNIDL